MKKIAILAPYVGSVNRGAETFVIELTKKLSQTYEIDVFSLKKEPQILSNIVTVQVQKGFLLGFHEKMYEKSVVYRKVINKCYYLIPEVVFEKRFSKSVFKIIENRKYDLIFPNNGVWGCIYANKLRKQKCVPYIYTGHGGIGYGEKEILKTKPNAYVCLTNKHMNWAERIKERETMTLVIPNGVNVQDFSGEKERRNSDNVILSVGALTQFKRHELTIKAMKHVKDARLVILGKGEEENELKKLADKCIPGRYTISSVPYCEISKYYKMADLFVLPSYEEPFGIVYLEAMSADLPIVVPNDSQRHEIVGEAGLYCDVEDEMIYAKTMEKALKMEWGNIPNERAKSFDWSIVAAQYVNLINRVLN